MVVNGLIFSTQDIQKARENRALPPYTAAWSKFESTASDAAISADFAAHAAYNALRWQLLDDQISAQTAIAALESIGGTEAEGPLIDEYQRTFAIAQAIACIDNYPDFQNRKSRFLDGWHHRLTLLNTRLSAAPHESAWSALLMICAGVLLDRAELSSSGAQKIRELTDNVTAHGYVPAVVQGGGGGLERTIQLVQAMCLAAEVGERSGSGLWGYEQRGVSIMTAALYPLYYYYYPEKWPWDGPVPFDPSRPARRTRRDRHAEPVEIVLEPTQALFRRHASFLELINLRTAGKVRAVTLILDELRPIVDLFGGGPVTLTHALPPQPKRRGFFGR